MKSVLSDKCCKKEEKPFPKLMVHSEYGSIVMMKTDKEGTVVHVAASSGMSLGQHEESWVMRYFSDYEGDVCLTND